MSVLLLLLLVVPFANSLAACFLSPRVTRYLSVLVGGACFAGTLVLVPAVLRDHAIAFSSELRVDALSVVFLLAVSLLYATTAVFCVGYVTLDGTPTRTRYGRRFYVGLNLFCWSMVAALLVSGLALLWIAVEITTVVSALLVAIDDTDGAIEAAWKYVLLASLGLGLALLATVVMYYAGTTVFGVSHSVPYPELVRGATHFSHGVVGLAFVLAVIGYGTKMGLVPLHTWLPDAHSEAPTPVSALLSGSLLAVSFYAILRFMEIALRTLGPTFPRNVLLIFGVASLVVSALYLLSQRDLKRLLAYSSVEHMGILCVGMSFGVPLAVAGVMLQVLAHAAAKSTAFFGAGSLIRKFGTKDMARIRGGVGALPLSGPMFVLAVLALSAMPPFGAFRSEFWIVEGGLRGGHEVFAALLIALVTVAFFGLSWFTTHTMVSPDASDALVTGGAPVPGEVSGWIVASMAIGLVALLIMGVHPPAQLSELLRHAATPFGLAR